MVTVRLYVEGGGDSKKLRVQCRRGFRKFVEKAGLKGRMPRIVACGGRQAEVDPSKVERSARHAKCFPDTLRAGGRKDARSRDGRHE